MNTPDIENVLRHAPRPLPPAGLKEKLEAGAPDARRVRGASPSRAGRGTGGWLARWWPALAPAAATLACAAVLTVQQKEISDLKAALQAAPPALPVQESRPATEEPAANPARDPAGLSAPEVKEITRLKAQADKLTTEVSRLEKIAAENEQLRKQLAAGAGAMLTPEETKALEAARERAMSITCVNNLKQLGLAARIWALDNGDTTPANLLQMTNEMNTPKILFCPADTDKHATADWKSFTSANCSYEYLAPSAPGIEPNRVLFRCPIHGNLGMVDGSVQMGVAKSHPEWVVQKDGKLYFQRSKQ